MQNNKLTYRLSHIQIINCVLLILFFLIYSTSASQPIVIYSSSGTFSDNLTNIVDNDNTTYVNNNGNHGIIVFDLGQRTIFSDVSVIAGNMPPTASLLAPQNQTIQVQQDDSPDSSLNWETVAVVSQGFEFLTNACGIGFIVEN